MINSLENLQNLFINRIFFSRLNLQVLKARSAWCVGTRPVVSTTRWWPARGARGSGGVLYSGAVLILTGNIFLAMGELKEKKIMENKDKVVHKNVSQYFNLIRSSESFRKSQNLSITPYVTLRVPYLTLWRNCVFIIIVFIKIKIGW